MEVIHGLNGIRKFRKPVVALGVFDGVHLAHQHILKSAVRIAGKTGGKSIALTFDPHPQREDSLYSLEHRIRLIARLGIDVCIVINFTRRFSHIKAEDFIRNILVRKIGSAYIIVGSNFRFGMRAKGDIRLLGEFAKLYNFRLKVSREVNLNNRLISSTFIRKSILAGNLMMAQKLLGRRVSILGNVVKGASLARKLGFPTANINVHHEVVPPSGVYIVEVILGLKRLYGVCSIGTKPTLYRQYAIRNRRYKKHIEVHIFDFKKNIYAEELEVIFIKKIREQEKFASLALLAQQIKKDITFAKKFTSLHRILPQYMPL